MEKILITGLVGKAIEKISNDYNYQFVFLSSKDCDLISLDETRTLFKNTTRIL